MKLGRYHISFFVVLVDVFGDGTLWLTRADAAEVRAWKEPK